MNSPIRRALQLGACSLIAVFAACKQESVADVDKTEVEISAKPMSEGAINVTTHDKSLNDQVSIAVADLAESSGVAADAISIVQARTVTWGSSALGCPRKDMDYTQAVVPGVLLILEANGKIYRYHGRTGGKPFHCPDNRAQAPAYGQGEEFM